MEEYYSIIIPVLLNGIALAVSWGKLVQRINHIEKRIDEEKIRSENEARDIQKIQVEAQRLGVALWGIDGQNGLRFQVRDVSTKVEQIQSDINDIRLHQARITDAIEAISTKLDR